MAEVLVIVFVDNHELKKILLEDLPEKIMVANLIAEVFKKTGYDLAKYNIQDIAYHHKNMDEYISVNVPYEDKVVNFPKYQLKLETIKENRVDNEPIQEEPKLARQNLAPQNRAPESFEYRNDHATSTTVLAWKSTIPEPNQNDLLTRHAFGQNQTIGALYDARKERFCGKSVFPNGYPAHALAASNNLPCFQSKVCLGNSFKEFFEMSGLEHELKASYIANLVKPMGYANYLSVQANSDTDTCATKIYGFPTTVEFLRLSDPSSIEKFSIDQVDMTPDATHLVIGIKYGGSFSLTINVEDSESLPPERVEEALMTTIRQVTNEAYSLNKELHGPIFSYSISHDLYDINEVIENHLPMVSANNQLAIMPANDMQLALISDNHFSDTPANKTSIQAHKKISELNEVNAFYNDFPTMVASLNEGKGVPIKYYLLPIDYLVKYMQFKPENRTFEPIDSDTIKRLVDLYDDLRKSHLDAIRMLKKFNKFSYCIPENTLKQANMELEELNQKLLKIQEITQSLILAIRNKTMVDIKLQKMMEDSIQQDSNNYKSNAKDYLGRYEKVQDKIQHAMILDKLSINYVGKGKLLDSELSRLKIPECYIFFGDPKNEISFKENKKYFHNLIKETKMTLIFVDLEVSKMGKLKGVPPGNRICHYKNTQFVETDLLAIIKEEKKHCFAGTKPFTNFKPITNTNAPPKKRVNIEMPCPTSALNPGHNSSQTCSGKDQFWYCVHCKNTIEYGFDSNFYCDCGYAPANTYYFKCNEDSHDKFWYKFSSDDELNKILSRVKPYEKLNILVLGETGVGKTTCSICLSKVKRGKN